MVEILAYPPKRQNMVDYITEAGESREEGEKVSRALSISRGDEAEKGVWSTIV